MSVFQFPAHRPWTTISFITVISAIAALGTTRDRAERVSGSTASRPGHEFSNYINKNFGSDGSNVLLLVDCPGGGDLFSPAASIAFKDLLQRVQALPEVTGMPGSGLLLSMFPDADATSAEHEACRNRALKNPVIAGNLLATNAQTALVPLRIRPGDRQAMEKTVAVIEKAAGVNISAEETSPLLIRSRLIGLLPIDIARREAMKVEQRRFQIIGYSLAAILALLFFRGLITTFVVTAPPSIGLLWTLGFLGYSGEQLNSLSMVVMPMILAMIGFTNAS